MKKMICDTKAKNYSFIIEILVITAWIGLLWWYTKFAVFDSFAFYDAEHNYHYIGGLRNIISCFIYLLSTVVILLRFRANLKKYSAKKCLYGICFVGIIFIITCVYGILSSEIRQVVVEDTGFYVYKHSVKNLDSQWYNFDYLKTHNIQLLDGEVYFCEVKPNNAGWNRESFIGVESDNICKLVNELNNSNTGTVTTTVNIKVLKVDKTWKVDCDDAFINAITGNLKSTLQNTVPSTN